MKWLPDMDLNHDKQIQSLLCYRYTIGQTNASGKLENFAGQSSRQTAGSESRKTVAHGVSRGLAVASGSSPVRVKDNSFCGILSPLRGLKCFESFVPRLALWATICRPAGALH